MRNRRELVALVLGAVMIAGAGAVIMFSQRPAAAPTQTADADSGGLKIPTVEEMCKRLGAAEGDALKKCRDDEQAAGEFVIAWMGLNGFIIDGEINLGQIQLLASLDDTDALSGLGSDPSLGLDLNFGDPSADPSLTGDPSAGSSQITSGVDPLTGFDFSASIVDLVHERFDPAGKQLITSFEAENGQIYVDEDRLSQLGLTLREIARFLESQPFIFAAFTQDEVRRAAGALK
jgi:hypothetical protein